MLATYACADCNTTLHAKDVAYRCGLCSSSMVEELDGAIFCESCGQIRASDLCVECGLCGSENVRELESAF